VPRVVLAVDGDRPAILRRARRAGVDLIEARVDQFRRRDPSTVAHTIARLRHYGLPVIGTVRSRLEGGATALSEVQRLQLYARLIPLVDAVDVELRAASLARTVIQAARKARVTVLVSYHDFHATPSMNVLTHLMHRARHLGADVIKIATMAQRADDITRLLEFTLAHRRQHVVTIAMGPAGSVSRLMFPLAGSLLTYTHDTPSHGQLPLRELATFLRRYSPAFAAAHRG
jgi:3-dehydroquinate dehydratase-1